jgi:acyl-CoA synthetase (AMP-forming)/AMP-acid ligase II
LGESLHPGGEGPKRLAAKLWLPDDVVFMDALPIGPTGTVQKMTLRERYARQAP